jgi:hypothetical protein
MGEEVRSSPEKLIISYSYCIASHIVVRIALLPFILSTTRLRGMDELASCRSSQVLNSLHYLSL